MKQGNTLETGLRHLVNETAITLTAAETDLKWPVRGAAVVVDRISGTKGPWEGLYRLNGEKVETFSSDLTAGEELADPVKLKKSAGICFIGSYVLGKGFVLSPEEALPLLEEEPSRAEVLRPYIGGRELNNNVPARPDEQIPHGRYVIAFGDRTEAQAREWPVLMERVERLVKPERERLTGHAHKHWWQFERMRRALYLVIEGQSRCLVSARVTSALQWAWQSPVMVFSEQTNVVALAGYHQFSVLQSRMHEAWARSFSSSMKTDLRYTPSTCFETFPFPRPTPAQADLLARTGEALYRARAEMMVAEQMGMTQVWNRLHDVHDQEPDIQHVRALRDAMDDAVLAAYGWGDVKPDDSETIVTKLRELNAKRAAEEAAEAAEAAKKMRTRR